MPRTYRNLGLVWLLLVLSSLGLGVWADASSASFVGLLVGRGVLLMALAATVLLAGRRVTRWDFLLAAAWLLPVIPLVAWGATGWLSLLVGVAGLRYRPRPGAGRRAWLWSGALLAGLARAILELVFPALGMWLVLVSPAVLALWALVYALFHSLMWPRWSSAVLGLLVLAAVGVPITLLQSPATQYNVIMVLVLAGFILAAGALATLFSFLFLKTFEKLDRKPLVAFVATLPLLAAPTFLVMQWMWSLEVSLTQWRLLAAGLALDVVMLAGLVLVFVLRAVGRRVGRGSFVSAVAWKFLRSQKMVPTWDTRRALALRQFLSQPPAPLQQDLLVGAALLGLTVAAFVLPGVARFSDDVSQGIRLALLGLVAELAWIRACHRPWRSYLIHCFLGALSAGLVALEMLRFDPLAGRPLLSLGLHSALATSAVLVLVQGGIRFWLRDRFRKGRLPAALNPALAPPIRTRIREGVGASMFVSVVGVAIGVWALIVVLSVMGGFSFDLQGRMASTKDHITVKADSPSASAEHMLALAAQVDAIPGVASASPYVQGDVMMASSLNISPTVELRGIDPWGEGTDFLAPILVSGGLELLRYPEDMVPLPGMTPRDVDTASPVPTQDPWEALAGGAPEEPTQDEPEPDEIEAGEDSVLSPMPDLGLDDDEEAEDLEPVVARGDVGSPVLPPLLIGQELSNSLGVHVGQTITVISPDGEVGPMGVQPKARSFLVAGVFATGMYDFDLKLAYGRTSDIQRFLNAGNQVGNLDVRLIDPSMVERVVPHVERLDLAGGMEIETWKQKNKSLFSAMELERLVMFVVLGFIILIASFNIVTSLIIVIRRRLAAIAILKTLGSTSSEIVRIFFVLGLAAGLFGLVSGIIMGLSTCGVIENIGIALPRQYYIRTLPVRVDPWQILQVALAALVITGLAALYPGRLAARTLIVEGLKDER